MLTRRAVSAVAAVAAGLVSLALGGCSSSHPVTRASAAAPSGQGTAGPAGPSVSAAALATTVSTALNALSSAHLDIDAGSLGGTSTADVTLSHGHATAVDTHLTKDGQSVEEITVGGTSYVTVPGNAATPWAKVSATSSNPIAKGLATGISVAKYTTSLSIVTNLVESSTGLVDAGTESLGDVRATRYTMKLDPKAAGGVPELAALAALGGGQVPVDLWLDAKNRPVKFTLHLGVGGSQFPVTVAISKFDVPVTITAPPPDQVAAD